MSVAAVWRHGPRGLGIGSGSGDSRGTWVAFRSWPDVAFYGRLAASMIPGMVLPRLVYLNDSAKCIHTHSVVQYIVQKDDQLLVKSERSPASGYVY